MRAKRTLFSEFDMDPCNAPCAQFRIGDQVEALFQGKSKYYKGVITRDNRDGTFDIDYDDGEREMGVAEELIRSLEPAAGASALNGVRSPLRPVSRVASPGASSVTRPNSLRSPQRSVDMIASRPTGRPSGLSRPSLSGARRPMDLDSAQLGTAQKPVRRPSI